MTSFIMRLAIGMIAFIPLSMLTSLLIILCWPIGCIVGLYFGWKLAGYVFFDE